jgi:hypothetical protein
MRPRVEPSQSSEILPLAVKKSFRPVNGSTNVGPMTDLDLLRLVPSKSVSIAVGGPVGAVVGGAVGAVATRPGSVLGGRCHYRDRYGHVHYHYCH